VLRKMSQYAEITLVLITGLLFLEYYSIFNLSQYGNWIIILLWGYLLVNVSVSSILQYYRTKEDPTCPKCKNKLRIRKEFDCSKCGKLHFNKNS
jgi:hypothetical protein